MSDTPLNKRPKLKETELSPVVRDESADEDDLVKASSNSVSPTFPAIFAKSQTPRKLVISLFDPIGSPSQSIPFSSSLQAPSLQPPDLSSRGRSLKSYSQSPPRSPGRSPARSPTRKLELIQLSPVKNSRIELQKIYDAKNEGKVERLCINQLVLHDFKSYAGEQLIGPFDSSFSAVVGPNGSGKSNVIDSMLFVFGFRASKMRQDRLSDLIHKSEKYPDLKSCAVEVHFQYVIDEPNGITRVNDQKEKLVITREAFKNNSSKYYINGKESNFTNVTSLLNEKGIDLDHNRFLILQGEVENIAQMKPKAEKESDDGLLEYLEDIIGTAKYKPLIEKKFVEIEVLNEICIEKENRFDIVDHEKNSLESGKDDALEYLEKEKALTLLKSKLMQYNLWQNNKKMTNTLEKINKIKYEFEIENNKKNDMQGQIEQFKELYNSLLEKLKSNNSQEKKLILEKRSLESGRVSSEEQMKNSSKKKIKVEKDILELTKTITESEAKLVDLRKYQIEYEDQFNDLHSQSTIEHIKLEKIKLSLKDKTVDFTNEIAQHENDLEPWNLQLQEKKCQIQLKESEISLIKEGQSKILKNIEQLKLAITSKVEEKLSSEREISKLKKLQLKVSKEILVGATEYENAGKKINDMQDVLNQHRQRAVDARTSLSTAENKSKVLTSLMKLQKSGRISGFYGRLGDLAVIDDKYDIAISTACPRLDDIVVESVECGQLCIEYLRKNKLGYARFILLDKLRKFDLKPVSTPENAPRLYDLLAVKEEKFLPAFYSVLRDTLVAQDLRTANKVAYGQKRYRVVTIDGKLFDISGTISGGGNHVSRGLIKLNKNSSSNFELYSLEDVEKLENELTEREKNYQIANDTFLEMEKELKRLKESEPEIDLQISKYSLEIDSLENENNLMKKQLDSSEITYHDSINDNEQLFNVEKELTKLMTAYSSLEDQTKYKTDRINVLKEYIMKVGGIDLQVQHSKVDSINQKKDIILSKQKRDKSYIKKAETELKKASKKLEDSQYDLTSCSKNLEEIYCYIQGISTSILQLEKSIEESQDSKDLYTEQAESIKEKVSELEDKSSEFKAYELEFKNRIEKLDILLNHTKKEVKALNSSLNSLEIRDLTHTLQLLDEGRLSEDSIKVKVKSNDIETDERATLPSNSEEEVAHDNYMQIDEFSVEISRGIPRMLDSEFKYFDLELIEVEIAQLQDYIDTVNVDIDVLEEYVRRIAEYKKRKLDLNNEVERREMIREQLEELKKNRFEEFMQGFGVISMTLKEMYQMITMGGNAELELVDSLDPFSEGVTFSVMPPKKSWRNISNLSGGEKTLSSLALVFALHKYKPTPLYVMDEIDAALDFRNVSIVANYIKERTKNAQFIVISLRNNMFELAEQLVGIYKCDNQTKSATLKNRDLLN